MKHTPPVTLILILLFLASQLIGLALIAHVTPTDYVPPTNAEAAGRGGSLLLGVLIGTAILLLIIRFKLHSIWKAWYFFAVWMAMGFALEAIMPTLPALGIALGLAIWKAFRPSIILHNLTEILVYSGIALLVTVSFNMNVLIAALLLLAIALYDAYAVWKSKHMVKMAEFQTKSNLFAGLLVPYNKDRALAPPPKKASKSAGKAKTAVLGGGDIAFPLIFSAAALQWLITLGYGRLEAFLYTIPIVLAATIALTGLFVLAKQDRYYPAMPFITAGCYAGYALTWILSTIGA